MTTDTTTRELGAARAAGAASARASLRGDPRSEGRPTRGGLARSAAWIAGSQIVLGAVGVATLPVLTRKLGAADYGEFSLFVTLLGVVTYQDVARQLLIREETTGESSASELDGLARVSTLFIVGLALALGVAALEPLAAVALVAASALHGVASRDFAALSADGRAGFANAARNYAWAGAFACAAGISFAPASAWAVAAPFVAANGALALVLWRSSPLRSRTRADSRPEGISALRRSPNRERFRRAALDLLGFTLASSAIASLDRLMLGEFVGGESFGVYCGAADVALRVHVVSSALSAALFPMLARELHERGYDHAASRFVSIASRAAPLYFVALALGMALAAPLLPWLLGADFAPSTPIFVAMLAVIFVHSFGFLATPWQRAQGDFATQRRAYLVGAALMLLVGVVAIPRWGAWGAFAAFAAARVAELQLVGVELARLPRSLLPRWKIAAAAAMTLALAAFGCWRIARG